MSKASEWASIRKTAPSFRDGVDGIDLLAHVADDGGVMNGRGMLRRPLLCGGAS